MSKSIQICLRVSPEDRKFLDENAISPTKLLRNVIADFRKTQAEEGFEIIKSS